MDYRDLKELQLKINTELLLFFGEKLKEAKEIDPFAESMVNSLRDFTMRGGKRIRAVLIYCGYKNFKEPESDDILKACTCIELIQNYMLIHDDIIDRDDKRRGGPTAHRFFEDYHRRNFKKNDPMHFGTSIAMLLGNLSGAFANELLTGINIPPEDRLNAINEINRMLSLVIYGEALDVLSELKEDMMEEDLLKVHRYKTSSYTFNSPLRIGAFLAGKTPDPRLDEYATNLGMAFQLQDDILGLFGDELLLGKPIGSDFREGKTTLLTLKAMELSKPAEIGFLKKVLGKKDLTMADIRKIRGIIKGCGSLDYSVRLINSLVSKAKDALFDSPVKSFLLELADYLLERKI